MRGASRNVNMSRDPGEELEDLPVHTVVLGTAMAVLEHRQAGALEVQEFFLSLLEDGERKRGRAGAEIDLSQGRGSRSKVTAAPVSTAVAERPIEFVSS